VWITETALFVVSSRDGILSYEASSRDDSVSHKTSSRDGIVSRKGLNHTILVAAPYVAQISLNLYFHSRVFHPVAH
jgi:hypothetical protein